MKILTMKVQSYIGECEKHISRINRASKMMESFIPLEPEGMASLDDEQIGCIDQFLFRFIRLQDTMGENLFKNILLLLEENLSGLSFIDILNRLEQLELLNKQEWINLRSMRNRATHEYPDMDAEIATAINSLHAHSSEMETILKKIKNYLQKRALL